MDSSCYGGLAQVYDRLMEEIGYQCWVGFILREFDSRGVTVGARVLDVACGTGTVTLELASRGFNVTGVNKSGLMLAVAEQKARGLDPAVTWVCQDMRNLHVPGMFDAVTCLCDSINYLLQPSHVQAFFHRVSQALRPGGVFIFDVNSRHKLETVYGTGIHVEDYPDFTYILDSTWDPKNGVCQMDLSLFIRKGQIFYERFDETHRQRFYSNDELVGWLAEEGFAVQSVTSDYGCGEEPPSRWVFLSERI